EAVRHGAGVVPTQPGIDGEPRADLDIVLNVQRRGERLPGRRGVQIDVAAADAQHEGRQRVAGRRVIDLRVEAGVGGRETEGARVITRREVVISLQTFLAADLE